MNLFHKTTGHAPHFLLGLLLLGIVSSLLYGEISTLHTSYSEQPIVPAAHLLRLDTRSESEMQRLLAAGCTPGFVCGSRQPAIKARVSGKAALRLALGMGLSVSR